MTELENIKLFFTDRRNFLSVKAIAEKSDIKFQTLNKFILGERSRYLTKEQINRLIPIIVNLGYIPIEKTQTLKI
jgi:hypothetical protein